MSRCPNCHEKRQLQDFYIWRGIKRANMHHSDKRRLETVRMCGTCNRWANDNVPSGENPLLFKGVV